MNVARKDLDSHVFPPGLTTVCETPTSVIPVRQEKHLRHVAVSWESTQVKLFSQLLTPPSTASPISPACTHLITESMKHY